MNDDQRAIDLLPPNESELVFELGGPAYRLMQRVGIIKGAGPSVARRSVVFIAITWLPLLVFTAMEGHALSPAPRSAFLPDFATYIRFFVAVPLIFAAEKVVGPRMRSAGLRFIRAGIVRLESHSDFAAMVARVQRRREARLPEIIFIAIALSSVWFISIERVTGLSTTTWHTTWVNGELQFSVAGFWYNFVATPLVQFFALRWVWRLAIWTLFLWECTRRRDSLPRSGGMMLLRGGVKPGHEGGLPYRGSRGAAGDVCGGGLRGCTAVCVY